MDWRGRSCSSEWRRWGESWRARLERFLRMGLALAPTPALAPLVRVLPPPREAVQALAQAPARSLEEEDVARLPVPVPGQPGARERGKFQSRPPGSLSRQGARFPRLVPEAQAGRLERQATWPRAVPQALTEQGFSSQDQWRAAQVPCRILAVVAAPMRAETWAARQDREFLRARSGAGLGSAPLPGRAGGL